MKKFLILGSLLLIAVVILSGCTKKVEQNKKLSTAEAQTKAEEFINTYLMQSGNKAKISGVEAYNTKLYKMKVDVGSEQSVDSYISEDGTLFFPQALNIAEISQKSNEAAGEENQAAPVAEVKTKNSKPVVELFVMSYCPYGTQMQKGIIPVLETLKDKIDFKLEFVSYAMHDKKELDENLVQYCVQKDASAKLVPYLKCFLAEDGKGADCLKANSLNVDKCVKSVDNIYKVTGNYNDKSTWKGNFPPFNVDKDANDKYGVAGSPTLIINGEEVSASRDPQSLLTAVCSAFESAPKECETVLSKAAYAPGFGFTTTASNSAASCE